MLRAAAELFESRTPAIGPMKETRANITYRSLTRRSAGSLSGRAHGAGLRGCRFNCSMDCCETPGQSVQSQEQQSRGAREFEPCSSRRGWKERKIRCAPFPLQDPVGFLPPLSFSATVAPPPPPPPPFFLPMVHTDQRKKKKSKPVRRPIFLLLSRCKYRAST